MDPVLGYSTGQATIGFSGAGFPQDIFYADVQAPPTISNGGVVDAAGYQTTIAPGEYVAIFGTNLTDGSTSQFSLECPAEACVYPIAYTPDFGLGYGYVSVSFDVNGATYPGYPYFASPNQVNLIAPWELEGQTTAQVKVSLDALYGAELFSNIANVQIADYAPAFFVSCNEACAQDTNYNLISPSNPAKRGNVIILYANGLGPVTNPQGDGVPAGNSITAPLSLTTATPVVTIGGAQAQVQWSGLAPTFQGLYQINVVVPQNAATGSAVPISVQIGGATSPASVAGKPVTISVQ
jgi:uncharacterized protein (TIGR03437 family)